MQQKNFGRRDIFLAMALLTATLAAEAAGAAEPPSGARAVRIEEGQFRPGAGRITFRELPLGARNPTITPSMYGGDATSPTVSFGGWFRGMGPSGPGDCPRGAPLTGCVSGTPSAPLSIDPASRQAFIVFDSAPPVNAPSMSGTPAFNGSIAVLFDKDMAAVGLRGGYFDAVGTTGISIYDRAGHELGQAANRRVGQEFIGIATADLQPRIAGLEFHLVGPEPAGFGINSIRFAKTTEVDLPDSVKPPAPPPPPRPPRVPILP